jgi:hypothetical protein
LCASDLAHPHPLIGYSVGGADREADGQENEGGVI